jgi:sarcosine oxidase
MLRRVYPDYPEYAALTALARSAWLQLESDTGITMFLPTGGLLIGSHDSAAIAAARAAAGTAPHHLMSASQLRRTYRPLSFADDALGFLDEDAGLLLAEHCLRALQQRAVELGSELQFGARIDLRGLLPHWKTEHSVEVGDVRYAADIIVLSLGPWLQESVRGTGWPKVSVERTVSHWLNPGGLISILRPARMPFLTWADPRGEFCMLPALARGVKVKFHHSGERANPDPGPRQATETERTTAQARLAELSGLHLDHSADAASMYTNTRDGRFIVDWHPTVSDVVVASACSGHGFKFAPCVATWTAEVIEGASPTSAA